MQKIIFINGRRVKADKKSIHRFSPGALRGKGVFETMRSYQGKIFLLDKHLDRFLKGLKFLKIRSPYSRQKIKELISQALKVNKIKNARVRLMAQKQKKDLKIAVTCFKHDQKVLRKSQEGFKALRVRIGYANLELPRMKSIDYRTYLLAYRQALKGGYDEAILIDKRSVTVEGSRTNIFCFKKGKLYTPHLRCGCLPGITRAWVIQLTKKLGIVCRPKIVSKNDLLGSDEVFLTNAYLGIVPLVQLDHIHLGNGKPGRLTRQITRAYHKSVKHFVALQ